MSEIEVNPDVILELDWTEARAIMTAIEEVIVDFDESYPFHVTLRGVEDALREVIPS